MCNVKCHSIIIANIFPCSQFYFCPVHFYFLYYFFLLRRMGKNALYSTETYAHIPNKYNIIIIYELKPLLRQARANNDEPKLFHFLFLQFYSMRAMANTIFILCVCVFGGLFAIRRTSSSSSSLKKREKEMWMITMMSNEKKKQFYRS